MGIDFLKNTFTKYDGLTQILFNFILQKIKLDRCNKCQIFKFCNFAIFFMILFKVGRKLTQIIRYSKFTTAGTVVCAQWHGIISEGAYLSIFMKLIS